MMPEMHGISSFKAMLALISILVKDIHSLTPEERFSPIEINRSSVTGFFGSKANFRDFHFIKARKQICTSPVRLRSWQLPVL